MFGRCQFLVALGLDIIHDFVGEELERIVGEHVDVLDGDVVFPQIAHGHSVVIEGERVEIERVLIETEEMVESFGERSEAFVGISEVPFPDAVGSIMSELLEPLRERRLSDGNAADDAILPRSKVAEAEVHRVAAR